jgi:nucleotide-binding universal stress UspA family protein
VREGRVVLARLKKVDLNPNEGRLMNPAMILHPLDYEASATPALAQAFELARWHHAELRVVHVRSSQRAIEGASAARSGLRTFVESNNPDGVRCEAVILSGDPVTAVIDYAGQTSPDLLVVSKRGTRASKFRPRGVFAKEIARRVSCPTLAVPSEYHAVSSFGEILCPTNFSAASSAALRQALVLAQQSGGRLTVLHVLDGFPYETVYSGSRAFRLIGEYRSLVERVSSDLRSRIPADALNWCDLQIRVLSGVPHKAILSTAAEIKPDLIVMGLPVRNRLDAVLLGSTTGSVLRQASPAVLVVPHRADMIESEVLNVDWTTPDFDGRSAMATHSRWVPPLSHRGLGRTISTRP